MQGSNHVVEGLMAPAVDGSALVVEPGRTEGMTVARATKKGPTMAVDYSPLFNWVREREAVRVRRANGEPPPWTSDPIIANFRFCNVRREDDTVTIWIRENIRERFAGHPHLWLMLCIARQINWPDTLAALIVNADSGAWPSAPVFSLNEMQDILEELQADGAKVYTGAYTIKAPAEKGAKKIPYTCQRVIGELWNARERIAATLNQPGVSIQKVHATLVRYEGWGDFMAYQAVGDMIFTDILRNAPDRELWCAAGPGTLRGLNRLHGRPLKPEISQEQARSEIRKLYAVIENETGVRVEFNDVPNCLCETDKYLRVQNGEGEPRARYVAPATATPQDSTSPATSPQSAATAAIGPPTNTTPTPVSADARSHEAPTITAEE